MVWFCGDLPLWSFLAIFALPFDGVFIAEPFCDDLGFAEEDDADDVLIVWSAVFLSVEFFFEGEEDLAESDFFSTLLLFALVSCVTLIFAIFSFDGFSLPCGSFGDAGRFWIDRG